MSRLFYIGLVVILFIGCGSTTKETPKQEQLDKKVVVDNGKLYISEVMASNAHTIIDPDFSKFADYVELHNSSKKAIDISNYTLSDKMDKQKWKIPKGTVIFAGGYMIFWADGEDVVKKGYHTNFSLKAKGEAIALFDANKKLVDGFSYKKLKADVSVAKVDGKVVYMEPSALSKNSPFLTEQNLSQKPEFSADDIFFSASGGIVSIGAKNGGTIYYTLDGSYPTLSSKVYTQPLKVSSNTVIKARSKESGKLLSYVSTQSYFVYDWSDLAIVSLSMDEKHLMDDKVGIYTIGTNGKKSDGCGKGPQVANFFQKWKRPVNVEYYDKSKTLQFSQEMDIKISGSCSRLIPQKSFSFKTDKKYEKDEIKYKLFPNKTMDKITGFKLRNGGQDWYGTMFRDAFLQSIVKDAMDIDYQDYQPVAVFINGKYWGIYNIREKKNQDYLAENHPDVDVKKIDILQDNMSAKEGSNKHYKKMIKFIEEHDLSMSENYEKVAEMMDIENYMDYTIAETYFANNDWIYTNIRYWREAKNSPKWRWILEDLDLSMGQWGEEIKENYLGRLSSPVETHNNPPWSTFLFRSLLINDGFKSKFKSRYRGYLDITFKPTRIKKLLDKFKSTIESEVPRHIKRWKGDYDSTLGGSFDKWEKRIDHLETIIDTRNDRVRAELNAL